MTWGDRRRWANLSPLHVLQLHSPTRRPNCSMPQACPPSDLNASTRLARSGLWHRRFAGSFPRGSVTLAGAVSTSPPPSPTRIRVRFFSAPPARSPPLPWRVPRCSCFFHFGFSLSLSRTGRLSTSLAPTNCSFCSCLTHHPCSCVMPSCGDLVICA
jgi:hypothetical protein